METLKKLKHELGTNKKRVWLVNGLAILLTLMQVTGWQRSMKYETSVHSSSFFQKIGMLEGWQCILVGVVEWTVYCIFFHFLFLFLERQSTVEARPSVKMPKHLWLISSVSLLTIYIVYLIGCYPGFFNYDARSQLPQFMYEEVPYTAHHPLLHTLILGGSITFGYYIRNGNLSFGVFLYCLFQICVCSISFGYSIRFIYQYTRRRIWPILAFVYYIFSPSIVMFTMSTTKDIMCYAVLLAAVLKLYEIYRPHMEEQTITRKKWIVTAVLLLLSCLLRNNIVYAVVALIVISIIFYKQNPKGQLSLFISVAVLYVIINNGLIKALNAAHSPTTEALSVPVQQIARLYAEEGERAFNEEEQELLYAAIEPEMLATYNPFISDPIKNNFGRHLDVLKENKWEYILLWAKKGLQYPKIYLDSILDNTYQAWYPGTVLKDKMGYRYFEIPDSESAPVRPRLPWLYDLLKSIQLEGSYQKYPVLRLFFSIGAMMWIMLITWFYGLWRKAKSISRTLLPILLVCLTSLLGPVSLVRYYWILFCLFPVCAVFLFAKPHSYDGL